MTQSTGWQTSLSEPLDETVMVSLDLETTGLDSRSDKILEIGAVKFRGDVEIERFSALVDPGRDIPPFITDLTGISEKDLVGAPPIEDVVPRLTEFLGNHPMVGHNVAFDAGFLVRNGVPARTQTFDTYDLAYALLPGATEYGLGPLGVAFGLVHDAPHRALSDALVTRDLFLLMLRKLADLPPGLLSEFGRLAAASGWTAGLLAGRILDHMDSADALRAAGEIRPDVRELSDRLRVAPAPTVAPVISGDVPDPAHTESISPGSESASELSAVIAGVFGRDGHLSRELPGFEHRSQQERMAESVADAIKDGEHLIVEAGTGVGKSLAYLVPAALHALSGGGTVIVSTNTINLQEQLMAKDIPAARDVLRSIGYPEDALSAAQLKGRSNYLCYRRWSHARSASDMTIAEARLLAKTMVWLESTEAGDRAELRLNRDDQAAFTRLSSQGARGCPAPDGPCFLRAARGRAHNANIVVINHSLLLADMVMGGGLLPEHDALIIDEAHHLESVATNNFGFRVEQRQVESDLAGLSGDRGIVSDAIRALRAAGRADAAAETLATGLLEAVGRARSAATELFRALRETVTSLTPGRGLSGNDLRITDATRQQPAWSDLEITWENFDLAASTVSLGLRDMGIAIDRAPASPAAQNLQAVGLNLAAALESIDESRTGLRHGIPEPEEGMVCWLSARPPAGQITVNGAPLAVGPSLRDALFERERCVILTSGTLADEGQFDRIRETLGIDNGREMALGSPFDFKRAALVVVPGDIPEPNRPGFNEAVAQAIKEVAITLRDRVLVLFTSNSALNAARSAIKPALEAEGISVVAQGIDGPPHRVMRALDAKKTTVALGAASLWEGVDLEESSISALIVARLPFPVPSDPVFAARSELYDDGFGDYAVPLAVLRFRQGFGRLIRSRSDRGVFIVLDSRMATRGYGAAFRDSLPGCDVEIVRSSDLAARVSRWHEEARA
ncbi:MAG: DEAD/DEAH box helicase family protein [Chloroflexi bacterium]|nr:DEAD/DEAH box helicase family protein [Chloroflexota bacterium]